jgi:protein-L-isoaspartate(D-aspartate) O-methyltransferase
MLIAPLVLLGCQSATESRTGDMGAGPLSLATVQPSTKGESDEARAHRAELLRGLADEIKSARVLEAMGRVPRHLFVPGVSLRQAYWDHPAPIGYGQTISQPTVVAIMTEALELRGSERVLEIGTGSGYQAAILSLLASEVYTIEIVNELAEEARARLRQLGYMNVHVRGGDGYKGWPDGAPFDRILVTAAPDVLPRALLDQLAEGGVLVAPVGPNSWSQRLLRYRKKGGRILSEDLGGVRFVPMVPGDSGASSAADEPKGIGD